ncbi:hypothetical protein RFI_22119 [Reticulomyxa filosa]|uniref:Transmembrane protein n=1 Tax=Reticulomyxa filosa TaxID=46433 RepID=X6MNJ8_RETFI|nr:hypothetical protein RFI_22119 [Reticulomyxa filosa]|eukprot:ETO15246.1 hypothetical protein RFI_22119 [Reticulomyxa filosa]
MTFSFKKQQCQNNCKVSFFPLLFNDNNKNPKKIIPVCMEIYCKCNENIITRFKTKSKKIYVTLLISWTILPFRLPFVFLACTNISFTRVFLPPDRDKSLLVLANEFFCWYCQTQYFEDFCIFFFEQIILSFLKYQMAFEQHKYRDQPFKKKKKDLLKTFKKYLQKVQKKKSKKGSFGGIKKKWRYIIAYFFLFLFL